MKSWLPASLSSRLLGVFLVTAITAILLLAGLFSRGLGSQWQRAIAPHLAQYVGYLQEDLGTPPDQQRALELSQSLDIAIQVHDADSGKLIFTTRSSPISIEKISFNSPRRWRSFRRPEGTGVSSLDEVALVSEHHQQDSAVQTQIANVAVGKDKRRPVLKLTYDSAYIVYVEFQRSRGRGSGLDELLMAVTALAVLLGLCYLAIRHLLRPIGVLQQTVQHISEGDLSARTNQKGSDDLSILAQSVDQMSQRIEQMLEAKRELLLAISHELRSPLTRARIALDLLEPTRHQQQLVKDVDEMEALIAQLVESERLQSHVVLDVKPHDFKRVISDVVSCTDFPVTWIEPQENCPIMADEARLVVLIRNLLNNAIEHGKPEDDRPAEISIRLTRAQMNYQLTVTDNGPGIDQKHLASVTEAFYRPDASRTRKTGGIGLGLHLCDRIANAHGGSLQILSPEKGSENEKTGVMAVVTLPVSTI